MDWLTLHAWQKTPVASLLALMFLSSPTMAEPVQAQLHISTHLTSAEPDETSDAEAVSTQDQAAEQTPSSEASEASESAAPKGLDALSHQLCSQQVSITPGLSLPELTPAQKAAVSLYQMSVRRKTPSATVLTQAQSLEKTPIGDYIAYWPMYIQYAQKPNDDHNKQAMLSFMNAHPNTYLAERARQDFLRIKPDSLSDELYLKVYRELQWGQNDNDLKAWALVHELQSHPSAKLARQAADFLEDTSLKGDALVALAKAIVKVQPQRAREMFEIVLQKGRWDSARALSAVLPLPLTAKSRFELISNPHAWIKRQGKHLNKVPGFALYWIGLRLAPKEPEKAYAWVQEHGHKLTEHERSVILTLAAYQAAVNWKPEANTWFSQSPQIRPQPLSQAQNILAWRARAELMQHNWSGLIKTIAHMNASAKASSTWTYWLARAQAHQGNHEAAQALYTRIANTPDFYGLLAREALGLGRQVLPNTPINLDQATIEAFNQDPNFSRARQFYNLELYGLGHREWNWGLQHWPQDKWPQIAQWAQNIGLWHRSIQLAERLPLTQEVLDLRYPLPLEGCVSAVAKAQGVPSSWLYGLIRQESRFMPTARSTTNAMGWMQIMPGTGKLVARQAKLTNFHTDQLSDVATNLQIGSLYLNALVDNFSQQSSVRGLAFAAYNAGPRRVRQWHQRMTQPWEGAIFIESIPFYETRDYVKNVLANLYLYELRLNEPMVAFSTLVGEVSLAADKDMNLP